MRTIIRTFIVISISVTNAIAQNCLQGSITTNSNGLCNPFGYYMVFYDEFDGNSLDLSKWDYAYQAVMNDGNDPIAAYEDANVEVSGGTLKISTKQEFIIDSYMSDQGLVTEEFDYTTGWIQSKYRFGYGKFEIRCKIPYGMGFFPAFWLQGSVDEIYSEIDVFEFFARGGVQTEEAIVNIPKLTAWHKEVGTTIYECSENEPTLIDFSAGFHTFTAYWDFYKTSWYIDNSPFPAFEIPHFKTPLFFTEIPCNVYSPGMELISPLAYPNNPMNIIISQYLTEGINAPNQSTPFPGIFEIEYVKYYKKTPCLYEDLHNYNDIISANNLYSPDLLLPEDQQNIVSGSTIMLRDNVIINNTTNPNKQLNTFIASQSITIEPNVFIDKNSTTLFFIDPELCEGEKRSAENDPGNINLDSDAIKKLKLDRSLENIFPNPTRDIINIHFGTDPPFRIQLNDLSGRIILTQTCSDQNIVLNLSTYPSGIYLLSIFRDNLIIQNEKIIKY